MPRRGRNRFGTMGFRKNTPPKPLDLKAPVLDVAGLNRAYDWMAVEKVIGLRLALEWYAVNTAKLLFGKPLDADRQKTYDRAVKSKALGDNNPNGFEREHAWTTALRLNDKLWTDHKLPTIEEAQKRVVDVTPWVASLRTVVSTLNAAFASMNVQFSPTLGTERDFYENTVHVPVAELEAMVPQAPLKIAMNEAVNVAKALAIVTVDGVQQMDGNKFLTDLPVVLQGITEWAVGLNGSLGKPIGKAQKVSKSKSGAPKATGGGVITRKARWSNSAVIHVVVPGNPFKGQMNTKYALVVDGQTIGDYKKARRDAKLGAGCGPIEAGVDRGLLNVVEP